MRRILTLAILVLLLAPAAAFAQCAPAQAPTGSGGCYPALGVPQSSDLLMAWRPSAFPGSLGTLTVGSLLSGNLPLTGPLTIGAPGTNALTLTPGATSSAPATLSLSGTGALTLPAVSAPSMTLSGAGVALSVGSGAVNVGTSYLSNNQNALLIGTNASEPIVMAGPFAAPLLSQSGAQLTTGFGAYVFESLSAASENTAQGDGACISVTTGGGMGCFGESAGASQTTADGWMAFGNDTMRDLWSGNLGGQIVFGTGSMIDGIGSDDAITGADDLEGAASIAVVGGSTPTAGDVWTFVFTSANACGGGVTVNCTTGTPLTTTYTVNSSDTTSAALATHIAAAINGVAINYILGDGQNEGGHTLFGMAFAVPDATNHPDVVAGHYPSNWQVSYTATCSGTCGETVTVTGPTNGSHNELLGNGIFINAQAGGATGNAIVTGQGGFGYFCQACNYNAALGGNIAPNATNVTYSDLVGYQAGLTITDASYNDFMGAYSGNGVTTGQVNLILQDNATGASTGCITQGSDNFQISYGACVPSPTGSYQGSIANAMYFQNVSGTGATISPAQMGLDALPVAATTLTIGLNGNSTALTLGGPLTYATSTTGAGTETFTNSPCTGLTTEKWIPVQITGQTGAFYVPACQ